MSFIPNQIDFGSGFLSPVEKLTGRTLDLREPESQSSSVSLAGYEYRLNDEDNNNTMIQSLLGMFLIKSEVREQMDASLASLGMFERELPEARTSEWNVEKQSKKEARDKQAMIERFQAGHSTPRSFYPSIQV